MNGYSFDYDSGDLCLDFANTMSNHAGDHPEENLKGYTDLIAWGEGAGLVTPESAARLFDRSVALPEDAERIYGAAIQVREALYHIFSNRYAGRTIPGPDLEVLNSLVQEAMGHLRLTPADGEFRWEWLPGIQEANLILWSVARAAAELLTSDHVLRVRECEDDRGCGYLFIDQSKNHSRRWCSMESCGNRAKARRHYSKNQGDRPDN